MGIRQWWQGFKARHIVADDPWDNLYVDEEWRDAMFTSAEGRALPAAPAQWDDSAGVEGLGA